MTGGSRTGGTTLVDGQPEGRGITPHREAQQPGEGREAGRRVVTGPPPRLDEPRLGRRRCRCAGRRAVRTTDPRSRGLEGEGAAAGGVVEPQERLDVTARGALEQPYQLVVH